jgi:G3E family GTPase
MRVNLLFGFLGSGKTTLAQRLLQERGSDCKTALIVNEFGDVGVDGDILRGTNVDLIELNSGCMCCTLRGSLILAIEELRAKKAVERVIVEATGVAQPGELLETLADPSFTLEHTVGPLVAVVDAAKFLKLESMLGDFYTKQIEHADIVILNKVDLASKEVLQEVEAAVREFNSKVTVLFAVQCDVDSRLILEGNVDMHLHAAPLDAAEADPGRPMRAHPVDRIQHPHDHDHTHERDHDDGHDHLRDIESFVLSAAGSYTTQGLQAFFGALPDSVWRAKGFMSVDRQSTLVQYSLGQLVIAPAPMPPHQNLVFVGRQMNRAAIEARFGRAGARDASLAGA